MEPKVPEVSEGYPDVSEREGIHRLRKGDVIADPTAVDVDAIRKVAGMKLVQGIELRAGGVDDDEVSEPDDDVSDDDWLGDTVVVDRGHLLWEKPLDILMKNPVLTVGEVVRSNKELKRLAKLSEKSRTELIADKSWNQLSPLLERDFATPEQVEAFLRNERGVFFPIEMPKNIGVGCINLTANDFETAQGKFDNERGEWFRKVLGIVRQRFIDFMIKSWDVKVGVPRWSPRGEVRNRLCDGDTLTLDGSPHGGDIIQRNFSAWLSEALKLGVRDDSLRFYLPTFIPDGTWAYTSKSPSHFEGFRSLEVRKVEKA